MPIYNVSLDTSDLPPAAVGAADAEACVGAFMDGALDAGELGLDGEAANARYAVTVTERETGLPCRYLVRAGQGDAGWLADRQPASLEDVIRAGEIAAEIKRARARGERRGGEAWAVVAVVEAASAATVITAAHALLQRGQGDRAACALLNVAGPLVHAGAWTGGAS